MSELIISDNKNDLSSLIEKVSLAADGDVEKLQRLLDMQKDMLKIQAERDFNIAMAQLQPQLPQIKHDGEIKNREGKIQSTYAKYETIDAVIRPLYTALGFSVAFDSQVTDAGTIYTATLLHVSGHSRKASLLLPLDSSGSKNAAQSAGSTVSYAQRYLLGMLLNIVTTGQDNDGAGGFISMEEAAEIDLLLRDTGADKPKFLKYIKAESVQAILNKDYLKAKVALQSKKIEAMETKFKAEKMA